MQHRVCPQAVHLRSALLLTIAERETALGQHGRNTTLPFRDTQQVVPLAVVAEGEHTQPLLLVLQLAGLLLLIGLEHVFLQRQGVVLARVVHPHRICPHQHVGIHVGGRVFAGNIVEQVVLAAVALVV